MVLEVCKNPGIGGGRSTLRLSQQNRLLLLAAELARGEMMADDESI